MKYIVNSDKSKAEFIEKMSQLYDEHKYLRIDVKTGKQRSNRENAALHLYLARLAVALNEAGYDMRKTIKDGVEIPWSMETAKEHLWKPIQEAVIQKQSTSKADRGEYSKVFDVLNRHLAAKLGIYVPWPSLEELEK